MLWYCSWDYDFWMAGLKVKIYSITYDPQASIPSRIPNTINTSNLPHIKFLLNSKKRSGTSLCLIFCIIFEEEKILTLHFINWPKFFQILGNTCLLTIWFPVYDVCPGQISKRWCVKKYCSCDKVCQVLDL